MKNFYEMIQILEGVKFNEGRKYLAYYDTSEEFNIGEQIDYYSWDGVIKVGYRHDEDSSGRPYRSPVAWGIEGSLIKFKEDKNGEAIMGEDGNLIIEKEFTTPGAHGQNIPEPYKSGSSDITGFDEVMKILLAQIRKDEDMDEDYDWEEFDGTIHEDPDTFFRHHKKISHSGKEMNLGKLDDYSPGRLPWYKNPSAIPSEEIEEAKKEARQETNRRKGDEREYQWRLKIYVDSRTGNGITGHYPWFVMDHDHAMEEMKKHCYHDWVKERDHHDSNKYLGTWETGVHYVCKKCGEKKYERTAYNNWSGD